MITVHSLPEAIELAGRGQQSMVKCPAHDDGHASLHVSPGDTQPVLMTCHAGCTLDEILAAAGVDKQAILAERANDLSRLAEGIWTPNGTASHCYSYTDEDGKELFQVLRVPQENGKKTFMQRHADPSKRHGWAWNMRGVRRVLYRLPDVLQAIDEGRTVFVVEGEKDADSLRRIGQTATTSPMGAGKWATEYSQSLAGAKVIIISDADKSGRDHAHAVREDLLAHDCTVAIMEPMQGCKDITDHLNRGGRFEDLIETVPAVAADADDSGMDFTAFIEVEDPADEFVIPNVLARGERLLVTAYEGHGKSKLLRQLAVQCASGIHPWTGMEMEPQKVLYVDAENKPSQVRASWKMLGGLAAYHGRQIPDGQLIIYSKWESEPDLTSQAGSQWLFERIHAYQPDVVCMGPIYNMVGRDPKEEEVVRKLKSVVNHARGICGSAFIMEHHAPLKEAGATVRSVRPYGSSIFLRWPDFGYGLAPVPDNEGVYEWQKFRFPRVRERGYPTHIRWGKPNTAEWPWTPCEMDEDGNIY